MNISRKNSTIETNLIYEELIGMLFSPSVQEREREIFKMRRMGDSGIKSAEEDRGCPVFFQKRLHDP